MGKVTGVQPMHRAGPSHLTQEAVRSQRNPWPTLILPEMPLYWNYRTMSFLAFTMCETLSHVHAPKRPHTQLLPAVSMDYDTTTAGEGPLNNLARQSKASTNGSSSQLMLSLEAWQRLTNSEDRRHLAAVFHWPPPWSHLPVSKHFTATTI